MQQKIFEQNLFIKRGVEVIDVCRKNLVLARKRKKIFERLKEKEQKQYFKELIFEEQKEIDMMNIMRVRYESNY